MSYNKNLVRFAQILFFSALLGVLFLALKPPIGHFHNPFPIDKINHFIAFFVLMALGMGAFPKIAVWKIFTSLALLGILIELLQATPIIKRDMELMDFIVEIIAMLAVWFVHIISKIRKT